MSLRSLTTRSLHFRQCYTIPRALPCQTRPLTYTRTSLYPRKDSMDKDSIDTTASEYSKSGSDDEASKLDDTAFNSDITSPEAQEDNAGRKADGSGKQYTDNNPLNVSPANQEVSKGKSPTEGGPEKGEGQKTSGGGSPNKGSKVR